MKNRNRWSRVIRDILHNMSLINLIDSRRKVVMEEVHNLKYDFVKRLAVACTYKEACELVVGSSSYNNEYLIEVLSIDEKALKKYVLKHDPDLKKWGQVTETYKAGVSDRIKKITFSTCVTDYDWDFIKEFLYANGRAMGIDEPGIILKNYKENKDRMIEEYRGSLEELSNYSRGDNYVYAKVKAVKENIYRFLKKAA